MYNSQKVSVMKGGWNYSSSNIFSTSSPAPKIDDINANFGLSSTGKSNKVAYGKVYFKDSRFRNVTVQLNAFRTPPSN